MRIIHRRSAEATQEGQAPSVSAGYNKKPKFNKAVFVVVGAALLISASFYGGMRYQKHSDGSLTAETSQPPSRNFGNGTTGKRFGRSVFGEVTAISPTSISVQNLRSGTTISLAITTATKVKDGGQAASVGDIQNGDAVIVIKASSNASQASRIVVRSAGGTNGVAPAGGSTTSYLYLTTN